MGPKTTELHHLLAEVVKLLTNCGEKRWVYWLDTAKVRIEKSDLSGVTYLLRGYGGMGSFNDLVLHPLNGHNVTKEQVSEVNQKLDELRRRVYKLALEIKHEANISGKR